MRYQETIYQVFDRDKFVCEGSAAECAAILNVKKNTIVSWGSPKRLKENRRFQAFKVGKRPIEEEDQARYAIYDSQGEFVFEGTAKDCAKRFNVAEKTIRFWTRPAHHRRIKECKKSESYTADRINQEEWEGKGDMKVNVNYEDVHAAIEALKKGDPLTDTESAAALTVLTAVLGDYVPTWEEILQHNKRITALELIDYDLRPDRWKEVMAEISKFENKYL